MVKTRIGRSLMWTLVLIVAWALVAPLAAQADSAKVKLSVQKVRGADFLGRIAGSFRVAVNPPQNVRLVLFYVDGQPVAYASSHPFSFELDTRNFSEGKHRLRAEVHLDNGTVTTSETVHLEFRSERWQMVLRQSMYLYAFLVFALGIAGGWGASKLMRLKPRLTLLEH